MILTVRNKIQILPDHIALAIAAGEVVERPASVVKELIENSLDAGAHAISIDIHGGGLDRIIIRDDGEGIPYDEIELPFVRFATSKMPSDFYWSGVTTLGFRGEALPSIAAVAHVQMVSKFADDIASMVEVIDGGVARKERAGAPAGTAVIVSSLFKNVPARLKFLKSAGVETNYITQIVTQYVLGRPDVRFTFNSDNKLKLTSPGTGAVLDALRGVYGSEKARQFFLFDYEESEYVRVLGAVSDPAITLGTRNGITIMVNGRAIKNRNLQFAVESAYQGILKDRRYPIAILNIVVPHSDLDVNVHPAKAEVKFVQQESVFSAIKTSIRQALMDVPIAVPFRGKLSGRIVNNSGKNSEDSIETRLPFAHVENVIDIEQQPAVKDRLPVLRVVGQIASCYVVAEGYQGMYLIDQHAAHERVWYEKLQRMMDAKGLETQGLLEPVVVEIPELIEQAISPYVESLEKYGFDCEPFGHNSYVLRGIPLVFAHLDPKDLFLSSVYGMRSGQVIDADQDALIKTLACHGSVRAGQALSVAEMQELLRDLESCDNFRTCPHGRPTVLSFDSTFIEHQFGRR